QYFPHATQINLVRDYRSTPQIVDVANRLLQERTRADRASLPRWPQPLELISQREAGPQPMFVECSYDQAEAEWVTSQIKDLISAGHKGSDIAVLFRTNAQSALFEQALSDARSERTRAVRASLPRWPQPLELISQREAGPQPMFVECSYDQAEAEWVTSQIKDLISAGHKGSDIAVLFRTNAQSALFEQALSDADISYQVRGAERFFNRREVRDGILQLRAAAKSADDVVGEAVI